MTAHRKTSIAEIVHDLANSVNTFYSTVQFLELNFEKHEGPGQVLNRELITALKDECSEMNSRLDELRRLTRESQR
jgi:signal transduction histidine kinase